MLRITLNAEELRLQTEQTVLQVAREHGYPIPTLCHHEALEPFAACRLCMVEVDEGQGWKLVAACAHPCKDGLRIRTESERIAQVRRLNLELLLATSHQVPKLQELAREAGVEELRFKMDQDDCILCGLCVRACRDIVGLGAISLIHRGINKKVSPPFEIAESACIGCGTCVLICPTGAISLSDVRSPSSSFHPMASSFDQTPCRVCGMHELSPETYEFAPGMDQVPSSMNISESEPAQ